MGIVTCPHGLIIVLQCDLCTREAAHGRSHLLVIAMDVPSTGLHHEAVQVQSRPALSARSVRLIRDALYLYAQQDRCYNQDDLDAMGACQTEIDAIQPGPETP